MAAGNRDQYITEILLSLKDHLSEEGRRAGATINRLDRETDELSGSFDRAGRHADTFGDRLRSLGINALALNEIRHLLYAIVAPLKQIGEMSDAWKEMTARVNLFSESSEAGAVAMERLVQIAIDARTPLNAVANLYARLGQGLSEAGVSQQELLNMVQALSDAMLISGASTAEAGGAIFQFSQAMASGTLRGEEFNSVAEQAPLLLDAMAKELGVAKGELRAMAAEGQLTTDVVRRSMAGMSDEWREMAETIPVTIGRAMTNLTTAMTQYIGQSEGVTKATNAFSDGIMLAADNLEGIARFVQEGVIIALGAALLAGAKNMTLLGQNAYAATGAVAAQARTAKAAADAQVLASQAVVAAKQREINNVQRLIAAQEAQMAVYRRTGGSLTQYAAMNDRLTQTKQRLAALTTQLTAAEAGYATAVNASTAANARAAAVSGRMAAAFELMNQRRAAAAIGFMDMLKFTNLLSAGLTVLISYEVGKWLKGVIAGTEAGAEAFRTMDEAIRDSSETIAGLLDSMPDMAKKISPLLMALDALSNKFNVYYEMRDAEDALAETTERLNQRFQEISEETGVTVESIEELDKAIESGRIVFNEATGDYEKGVAAIKKLAQGYGDVDTAYARASESLEAHGKLVKNANVARQKEVEIAAQAAKAAGDEVGALNLLADARQVGEQSAQESLLIEEALLDLAKQRLNKLSEEMETTESANAARNAMIAELTTEIVTRRAAVAEASNAVEKAKLETNAAKVAAAAYGDQSEKISDLLLQRKKLTTELHTAAQAAEAGQLAEGKLLAVQQQQASASERLADAYTGLGGVIDGYSNSELKQLIDQNENLTNELAALESQVERGRVAEERAAEIKRELAVVNRLAADAADDLVKAIGHQIDAAKREQEVVKTRLDLQSDALKAAEKEAKARGDQAAATELQIKALGLEAQKHRELSDARHEEADKLLEQADAMKLAATLSGKLTTEKLAEIDALRHSAEMLDLSARKASQSADASERAARAAERQLAAEKALADGISDKLNALRQEAELERSLYEMKRQAIEISLKRAEARGDEDEAAQLSLNLLELERQAYIKNGQTNAESIALIEQRIETLNRVIATTGDHEGKLKDEVRSLQLEAEQLKLSSAEQSLHAENTQYNIDKTVALKEAQDLLGLSLEDVGKVGKSSLKGVADALAEVFAAMEFQDEKQVLTGVRSLADLLQRLGEISEVAGRKINITEEDIREGLGKSLADLTSGELLRFSQAWDSLVTEIGTDAFKDAGLVIDTVLAEALKRLKLDLESVRTGTTAAGREMVDAFNTVAISAKGDAAVVAGAWDAVIEGLKDTDDIDYARQQLELMFQSGAINAEWLKVMVKQLDEAELKLVKTTGVLAEAFKTLGITSSESLRASAEDALKAFTKIQKSGKASAKDVEAAWEAYAQAALASDDERLQSIAEQKAAALGLGDVWVKLEGAALKANEELKKSLGAVKDQLDVLKRDAELVTSRLELYKNAIEASRAMAEARGDEVAATELSVRALEYEAEVLSKAREGKENEAQFLHEQARLLEQAAHKTGSLTKATQDEIAALMDRVELLKIEAQQLGVSADMNDQKIAQLRAEQEATRILNDGLVAQIEINRQRQEVANTSLEQQRLDIELSRQQAEAKGQVSEVTRLQAEALRIELADQQMSIGLKNQELELLRQRITNMDAAIAASGGYNIELQNQRQALMDTAAALDLEIQALTRSNATSQLSLDQTNALAQAQAALGEAFVSAATVGEGALTNVSGALAAVFEQMRSAGGEEGEGFVGLESLLTLLQTLGDTSVDLGLKVEATTATITEGLGGALSQLTAGELADFALKWRETMDGFSGEVMETTAQVMKDTLGAALEALGLNLESIRTGTTEAGRDLIDTFTAVAASADHDIQIINEAWKKVLEGFERKEDINAAKDAIVELGERGLLSVEQVNKKLDDLNKKLKDIPPEIDKVAEAFERLGIKSSAALKKQAQEAKADFETIRNAGTSSADDVRKAWVAYAEAAIASGDKQLQLQAEIAGKALGILETKSKETDVEKRLIEYAKQVKEQHEANAVANEKAAREKEREALSEQKITKEKAAQAQIPEPSSSSSSSGTSSSGTSSSGTSSSSSTPTSSATASSDDGARGASFFSLERLYREEAQKRGWDLWGDGYEAGYEAFKNTYSANLNNWTFSGRWIDPAGKAMSAAKKARGQTLGDEGSTDSIVSRPAQQSFVTVNLPKTGESIRLAGARQSDVEALLDALDSEMSVSIS